jgi:hypothetical protein
MATLRRQHLKPPAPARRDGPNRARDTDCEPRTVRLSDRQPRTTPPEIGSHGAV